MLLLQDDKIASRKSWLNSVSLVVQTHTLFSFSSTNWLRSESRDLRLRGLFCECMAFVYGTNWLVWHVLVFNCLFNKKCINAGKQTAHVKPSHWVLEVKKGIFACIEGFLCYCKSMKYSQRVCYFLMLLHFQHNRSCVWLERVLWGFLKSYGQKRWIAEDVLLIHKPQKEKRADITQRIKHNPTNTLLEHINKRE